MVHRVDRLIDIIETMKKYSLEPKRIQFCYTKLEKEGKAFVFAPSKHLNLGTFSKDAALEQKLYDLGVSDYETQSGKLLAFLQK